MYCSRPFWLCFAACIWWTYGAVAASAQDDREAIQEHLKQAQAHVEAANYEGAVEELKSAQALHAGIPGSYYQLGSAYFELGQFEQAEQAFRRELTFDPPDPHSLYYLGRISADKGRNEEAVNFYEASLESGEVLDVTRRLATVHLRLRQAERAVTLLERALGRRPEESELHFLLGRAYRLAGREAEAEEEFAAAELWKNKKQEDIRGIMEVRRLLREQQVVQALDLAKRISDSSDPHVCLALGIALAEHDMNNVAERVLETSADLLPQSPEAQFNLGRVRGSLGDWEGSLGPLEKSVKLRPGFYEAQVMLGSAYSQLSRVDDAIRALRSASALQPNHARLQAMLGLQYLAGSYYQQAVGTLQHAVKVDPSEPNLRFLLIQAHFRNHDYEDAVTVAADAAKDFPDLARSHMEFALQLDNVGRLDEAQARLRTALEKDPAMHDARVMLAETLFKQGRAEESIAEFEKALAADNKLTNAHVGLGKALIQLKRYEEAVGRMQEAIAADENAPAPHLHLAQAYRALGRLEEAKAEAAVFTRLNREAAKVRDQDVERTYRPE